MPLAPDLFTVDEAARMLGLSPSSVRYAITRGLIVPATVHPRLNAITRQEIERYRRDHLRKRGPKAKQPAAEPADQEETT